MPVSQVTERLLPWTIGGFVVMVITGVLLFYAIPVRNYQSIFFRLKMMLLVLAGLNVWLFHTRIYTRIAEWDLATIPPPRGAHCRRRLARAWAASSSSGRMIAYNWFDCDIQPQPAFVNWAAGLRRAASRS